MKKLLRNGIGVCAVLLILLAGCEGLNKEYPSGEPILQATEDRPVAALGAGGPEWLVTAAEANELLQTASGLQQALFSEVGIEATPAGDWYLVGKTWQQDPSLPNSTGIAIGLYEMGGNLFLRKYWVKCTGNPCSSCSPNADKTGCDCNDTGTGAKCDFSQGLVSGWQ